MNENTVGRRTALAEQSARKQSEKMFETARMEDLAVLDKRHLAGLAATVERMPRRLKADCKAGRAADMRTFGFLTMQIWEGFSFVCTTRCPDVTFAHPLSSVPVAASTVRPAMILMVLSSKSMLAVKRIFLKKSIVVKCAEDSRQARKNFCAALNFVNV